jgi:hypothetical protein
MWVQSINQASDRVADIAIMFVIDQLFALILGSKAHLATFAVLVSPAREAVCNSDVKNGMVPVRNDINPEIVITRLASEI